MTAPPALTTPPMGAAKARPPQLSIKAIARGRHAPMAIGLICWMPTCGTARTADVEDREEPGPVTCSEVATQVPVMGLQMER